jgi:hypothetical protein
MVHMGLMGLLVTAMVPALLLAERGRLGSDRLALPAAVALPGFALLHAAVTLGADGAKVPAPLAASATPALLVGATVFWLPVFGRRRRLPDAGRAAYLFIAGPVLDLPAVWLVARGQIGGGLAMIVGMLPLGVAAIWVTWRWISTEERRAGEAFDRNRWIPAPRDSPEVSPP